MTPSPLDCSDLDTLFVAERPTALAQLADLNLTQLALQAYAYAAYCDEAHGIILDGGAVLACWNDAIARAEGV